MNSKHVYKEQDLLPQVAKGNQQAFRQLFDHLEGPLFYFAIQLIAQRQQAEDYVLIAFQKLWERRDGFFSLPAARSYLYTIVRNQCLNYLKHESMVEDVHHELRKDSAAEEDYIEYRMVQGELLNLIYGEIQALPEQYRQILLWTYLEELPTSEIAHRLSLEESSVRAARTRALAQLRKVLGEKKMLALTLLLLQFWQMGDGVS